MNLPKTQLKVLNAINLLNKNKIPATNYSISVLTGISPDNVRWTAFDARTKGYIKKNVKNGDMQFSSVRYTITASGKKRLEQLLMIIPNIDLMTGKEDFTALYQIDVRYCDEINILTKAV